MPKLEIPTFRQLVRADLPMLHEWLQRPHVAEWWHEPSTLAEVEREYLPVVTNESSTHAYIAMLAGEAIGFIQSYLPMDSNEGWWPEETDPGARGIDQFLADSDQLGRGLGSSMIDAFVERLFQESAVTKVQADPSPANERAIRSYLRAGFIVHKEVTTPDGPALLMLRHRRNGVAAPPFA